MQTCLCSSTTWITLTKKCLSLCKTRSQKEKVSHCIHQDEETCERISKSESGFGKNLAKVENSQVNMIMIVMKAFVIQLASFPLPFQTPSPSLKICLKHCVLGGEKLFFCDFPQKFPQKFSTKYFPPKTIFHLSTHIMNN